MYQTLIPVYLHTLWPEWGKKNLVSKVFPHIQLKIFKFPYILV